MMEANISEINSNEIKILDDVDDMQKNYEIKYFGPKKDKKANFIIKKELDDDDDDDIGFNEESRKPITYEEIFNNILEKSSMVTEKLLKNQDQVVIGVFKLKKNEI